MKSYDVTSLFDVPKDFKIVASKMYQENGEDFVKIDFRESSSFRLVMLFPKRDILESHGLMMDDETYLVDMVTEKFDEIKRYLSDLDRE